MLLGHLYDFYELAYNFTHVKYYKFNMELLFFFTIFLMDM